MWHLLWYIAALGGGVNTHKGWSWNVHIIRMGAERCCWRLDGCLCLIILTIVRHVPHEMHMVCLQAEHQDRQALVPIQPQAESAENFPIVESIGIALS